MNLQLSTRRQVNFVRGTLPSRHRVPRSLGGARLRRAVIWARSEAERSWGTVTQATLVAATLALISNSHAADLECRWAATPPVIDGALNDPAWSHAQPIETFTSAWLPEPERRAPAKTIARLLWDRDYLYFSAEMEDTDVFANVTEQDSTIWLCDVFELFFKPAREKTGYYEFEVNAANAKLDMFLPSRGSGGWPRHAKDRDFHIESKVQIRGTLNNWSDKDRGWTVEGRIPWRDFLPTGGRPAPGETWLHALCRYDYSTGLEAPALTSDAPLSQPNFHHYEDYVPLKFVGPHDSAAAANSRPPWDPTRLAGSPEPPLPFRGVPAFPRLKTKEPLAVVPEPGRDSFLLIECNGYVPIRKSRVCRLPNDSNATATESLLDLDESIYDATFHPQFAENGYVFFGGNGRFAEGNSDFEDRVLRYTMDRATGRIDAGSRTVIMKWPSHGHNGGALRFGRDGMLYVTSGNGSSDSDEWSSGQDLTRPLAKLLRIDVDHPAPGQFYSIPEDNPFVRTAGARGETWAYGFRNPWRMSIDAATGYIWTGENGQDLWEYARLVRRGENFGWPVMEGSHPFHQQRKPGPTPITPPLIEHSHTEFRSLTGGFVCRGTMFPSLTGCYIYGDYSTGQVWAATQHDGKLTRHECIADTPYSIAYFCETPQGDILLADYLGNAIQKLEPAPPATHTPPFPHRLSETGLFRDTATHAPHPALIQYEINAPAWHDGASIQRYVALPPNGRMEFMDQFGWNLPDGAAAVQTLSQNGRRIETRVLLRQQSEWNAYTYAWDDGGRDAELVEKEGRSLGTWRIPGRQECTLCHSRAANYVLGLSTVQLNRRGADGENQIAKWERLGLLQADHSKREEQEWRREFGALKLSELATQQRMDLVLPLEGQRPPAKGSTLLPVAAAELPRIVNPSDSTASLHDRARAYLHANCSHCHVRSGGGNSNMQLAAHIEDEAMEILDQQPMHGTCGVADARLVAPGAPQRSLLIARPAMRGSNQMPPVGPALPDPAGIALLAEWIYSLK